LTLYALRGGSWFVNLHGFFRAASRLRLDPDYGDDDFGFRTVLHLRKDPDL